MASKMSRRFFCPMNCERHLSSVLIEWSSVFDPNEIMKTFNWGMDSKRQDLGNPFRKLFVLVTTDQNNKLFRGVIGQNNEFY